MDNAVIAVSHAALASGIYSAIKMCIGDFDNIRIEEFKQNDNFDLYDIRLKKAYEELKAYKNIYVLADMVGGTPFNRAVLSLGGHANVRFLGGLSFSTLYKALTLEDNDIDKNTEEILAYGKKSLIAFD